MMRGGVHSVDVDQAERDTPLLGQRLELLRHPGADLGPLRYEVRKRFVRHRVCHVERLGPPHSIRCDLVTRHVAGDLIEPGSERPARIVGVESPEHPQERLLGCIVHLARLG
jgi:hypothetical protein